MTVRAQEICAGTEIEVLWSLEENPVWWRAVVEGILECSGSSIKARIAYKASHGHSETRPEVLIHDGMLVEDGVEMRWRHGGPGAADGESEESESGESGESEESEEIEGEDGGIIDDPTRSAMDVVQTGLAYAMKDRPMEEQRVLAERLSRALETLREEMQVALQGMAPGEEVNNYIAEAIVNRLGSSLVDHDDDPSGI